MKGTVKYMGSRSGWAAELLIMFVFGFLLATLLWVGLWWFQAKPAHAAALQAHETELNKCLGAKELCDSQRVKILAENQEVNRKLEEALVGWGRCIRSTQEPSSGGE